MCSGDEFGPMSSANLQIITPEWPTPPGVHAAFTLRTGGVSLAPYDSLNLGARIGDSPEAVVENRRRVREKLGLPAEPVWLEQVHGVEVVELGAFGVASDDGGVLRRSGGEGAAGDLATGRGDRRDWPPTGDASVARGAGQVCAIRVADCMPVL